MKPFDTKIVNGPMFRNDGSSVTVEPRPLVREYLVASPLIKGDRKKPNAHSYEYQYIRYPKGTNNWDYAYSGPRPTTGGIRMNNCVAWDATHPFLNGVSFPDSLRRRVLDKLNEKVRGSIDLSVDLFQAGQTAKMLQASRNASLFASTFRGWRGLVNGISSARLAFAYGWKPLVQTIYDSTDEAINLVISDYMRVRARESEPIRSTREGFPFEFYGTAYGQCERDGCYKAELCVIFETRNHDLARWTSLNPVSIAWELVPYSFVVDWVFNVGSYLRNLETSMLYANRFVSGYSSEGVYFDGRWATDSRRVSGYQPKNTYTVKADANFRYRKFQRSILRSYPAPRLPSFEVDLGTGRLFNLAALLGSKLKVR